MARLTDFGQSTISALAQQYGLSEDAVASMADAVSRGGGTMAQFSHPAFGGSGQWMAGGMTMVGDMFNHGLKMTVDNLCASLSNAMAQGKFYIAEPGDWNHEWWPPELGVPSTSTAQNDLRCAVFPMARRIAMQRGFGPVELFDTGEHSIGGVSQQQDGGGARITFSSQFGQFDVASLPRIGGQGVSPEASKTAPPAPPSEPQHQQSQQTAMPDAPLPHSPAPDAATARMEADPLAVLERLASLVEKGLLTREEFDAKKAELLSRI